MHMETNEDRRFTVAPADTKSKKLGRKNVTELSRLAILLEKHTASSGKTQRQIADAVGFNNQNMITMIKQGDAKLPLDRVPAMAHVLGVDPLMLFNMAIEQFYTPDAVKALQDIIPPALSVAERALIDVVREAGKKGKQLTAERIDKIRELLEG
jgi:transcriptional regulator with XRE-family HTH domain